MKKKIIFSLLMLLIFIGCSSNDFGESTFDMVAEAPMAEMEWDEFEDAADGGSFETDDVSRESFGIRTESDDEESIFGGVPILLPSESGRQLSYTVHFTIETTEFMSSIRILWDTISTLEGYVEYESINGRSLHHSAHARNANFDLRIPNEQLAVFLGFIEDNYNIVSYQRNLDDFTFIYERQMSHLTNLREQEDRLLADLEDGEAASNLTEQNLADVQSQIRDLEESNTIIERNVDYSDVSIRLNEVIIVVEEEEIPPTFGERLSETFDGTLDALLATLQVLTMVVVTLLPWWIMLGIVVLPIVFVVKRLRKKKG